MTRLQRNTPAEGLPTVVLVAPPPRASRRERAALLGAGLLCALVLALAALARPDPRGLATHSSSFGLPPCGFLEWSGYPCATCGMTTAFAHAVRGDLLAAARAQPLGLVLALGTAAGAVAGPALAAAGVPVRRRLAGLSPRTARGLAIGAFLAAVAAWIYKILATGRVAAL